LTNPDEAQKAALSAGQQSKRAGQACEAAFYIGVYWIEKAEQADARPLLQSAEDSCPYNFVEKPAAMLEFKRLDEMAGARSKD
jgi:lipoprotein NlpI